MIDPERVFSDIFNDQQLLEKSVITVLLSFAVILFPFGLVALAALLGYQLELLQNVRDGMAFPLPRWLNYGQKINRGVGVLIASVIYNLPNFFAFCVISAILSTNTDFFALISVCCCVFPVLLLINVITVPLQAVGTIRFAQTGRVESFLNFSDLFDTIRENSVLLLQWWMWATLANVLIGGLGTAIPCIGWLAMAALLIPIQGHLLGQLAGRLTDSKRKYAGF